MSFCMNCGAKAMAAAPVQASQPAYEQPVYQQSAPTPTYEPAVAPAQSAFVATTAQHAAQRTAQHAAQPANKGIGKGIAIGFAAALIVVAGVALAILQPWNALAPSGTAESQQSAAASQAASASSEASSGSAAASSTSAASSASSTSASAASGSSTTSSASAASTAPKGATPPVFSNASASSVTQVDDIDVYSPSVVLDKDIKTAWNSDGEKFSTGVGQWIELSSPNLQHVSGIRIMPGFCKDEATWKKNRRPHDITITFSDGTSIAATLTDTFASYQTFDFDKPVDTTSLRITIDSTYSPTYDGRCYNDCCISEIEVF